MADKLKDKLDIIVDELGGAPVVTGKDALADYLDAIIEAIPGGGGGGSSVSASTQRVEGALTANSININGTDYNMPEGGSGGSSVSASTQRFEGALTANSINIDGTNYNMPEGGSGGGTDVEGNPASYPQDAPNLEAIKIGDNYFKVPEGGGSDFPEDGNNDDVLTKIVVPGELVGAEINPTSDYEHIYLNCDQQDDEIRRIISLVSDSGTDGKQIYNGDNDFNLIDFQSIAGIDGLMLMISDNDGYLYVFEDVDLGGKIYKGWSALDESSGDITSVTGIVDLGSVTNGSSIENPINSELTKILSAGVEFQEIGRIESVEWRPGIPNNANDGDMLGYTILPPSRTGAIVDPEVDYEHIYLNCDLSGNDIQNIIDKLNSSDMYEQGIAYVYEENGSGAKLMLEDIESIISAPGLAVSGSNDSADNIAYAYVFNNIDSTAVGDLKKGWNAIDQSTGSVVSVSGIIDLGGFFNGRKLWNDECINDSLSSLFSAGETFVDLPSQSKYEWKPGVPSGGENNQVLTRILTKNKYEGKIPTEDGTITSVYCNCGDENIDTILNFVKDLEYDSDGVYKLATSDEDDDCWLQIKKYSPGTFPKGINTNTKDSYAIGFGQVSGWTPSGKQIAILDEDISITMAGIYTKRGVNYINFDNIMAYSSGKHTVAENLSINYTDFDSDVASWLKSFVSYNEDFTLIEKAKDGIEWRDSTGGGGTSVEANPTSYPPDIPELEVIKVGENYYKIPEGGGTLPTITITLEQVIDTSPIKISLTNEQKEIVENMEIGQFLCDATEIGATLSVITKGADTGVTIMCTAETFDGNKAVKSYLIYEYATGTATFSNFDELLYQSNYDEVGAILYYNGENYKPLDIGEVGQVLTTILSEDNNHNQPAWIDLPVIRYDVSQTLTSQQKAQVWANLGLENLDEEDF